MVDLMIKISRLTESIIYAVLLIFSIACVLFVIISAIESDNSTPSGLSMSMLIMDLLLINLVALMVEVRD